MARDGRGYPRRRRDMMIYIYLQTHTDTSFHCLQFFHTSFNVVFNLSLSDSMSPQVLRTLMSILVNLNNSAVCMIFILLLIYNFSSLFYKPLRTDKSPPATIGITITIIFHSFFSSQARSKYLSIFSFSLIFSL